MYNGTLLSVIYNSPCRFDVSAVPFASFAMTPDPTQHLRKYPVPLKKCAISFVELPTFESARAFCLQRNAQFSSLHADTYAIDTLPCTPSGTGRICTPGLYHNPLETAQFCTGPWVPSCAAPFCGRHGAARAAPERAHPGLA